MRKANNGMTSTVCKKKTSEATAEMSRPVNSYAWRGYVVTAAKRKIKVARKLPYASMTDKNQKM